MSGIRPIANAPATESDLRYQGWRVAGASAVGVFFASIVLYGFGILLKPLADEFVWSREAASMAFACFAGAAALAAPVVGRQLDRHGPLRVAVPCITLSGLGIASLSLLTPSRVHVYGLLMLLGVGAIGTSPLTYSRAVATWFDRRRGLALAIVIAGGATASITHPPTIAALVDAMGWRGACVVLGAIVLGVGLPVVVGLVRERPANPKTAEPSIAATVAGAVRSWSFWALIVVVAVAAGAFNAVVIHLVALLTDRGISPGRAALALSVMGVAGLIGRLLTGWLVDRFRATRVSAAVLSVSAAGLFVLADAPSLEMALLAVSLIGFGMGGELDVIPFLLSRYFGLRAMATLYGFAWTTIGAGAAAGSILMGRAFDATGSYENVLVRFAVATLSAGALMLLLPHYQLRIPNHLSQTAGL